MNSIAEATMSLELQIEAARGDRTCDLLLTNGRVVNVFSSDIIETDIAVADGVIVGFGPRPAREIVDLGGKYLSPGFIDAHVHIESSMVCPTEYARAVLPNGTTAVVADPHEIANVLGAEGIDYMLRSAADQPLRFFFTLSSCVPASPMETAGAELDAGALAPFLDHPSVVALAEVMNFPGVVAGEPDLLKKIQLARKAGKPIDGHAPGLSGRALHAYICAGIDTDHECTDPEEAMEKLNAGMRILIREGSGARNLDALLPIVTEKTAHRVLWCSDDRHPHDLLEDGHMDAIIRKAIRKGVDPLLAIRMGTLNPAEAFGIRDAGAVAPGRRADLVVFSDLSRPRPEMVFFSGRLTARDGKLLKSVALPRPVPCRNAVNVDLSRVDWKVRARDRRIRIIEVVPDQIVTRQRVLQAKIRDGQVVADPDRDLMKLTVIERHSGLTGHSTGFVSGFGLKTGALASSVAHDSHNLIVVGADDSDMEHAARAVVEMGGGLAAVRDGNVLAAQSLPVAGLMATETVDTVRAHLDKLIDAAKDLGATLPDPYMTLSFLALPVIPELKLTDRGLVDVNRFEIVDLFVS